LRFQIEYYRTGHLQLSEKLSLAILHTELDYWQLKDAMAETEKQIIAKEAEESAKSLGRDLSQLALEEKRKTIDSHFYGLLHNQLRQGIKHAAKRGRHRVTFRFASKFVINTNDQFFKKPSSLANFYFPAQITEVLRTLELIRSAMSCI
jgi:hypothetical protein